MPNPGFPDKDYIHGVKGKVSYLPFGADENAIPIDLPVESVTINIAVESDDVTHSGTNGWRVVLDGLAEVTGDISFVWDALNAPLVAGHIMRPRTYPMLTIFPDGVTPITFPALITGAQFGTGPKNGTVRITGSYRSAGTVIYPTESQTEHTPDLDS